MPFSSCYKARVFFFIPKKWTFAKEWSYCSPQCLPLFSVEAVLSVVQNNCSIFVRMTLSLFWIYKIIGQKFRDVIYIYISLCCKKTSINVLLIILCHQKPVKFQFGHKPPDNYKLFWYLPSLGFLMCSGTGDPHFGQKFWVK